MLFEREEPLALLRSRIQALAQHAPGCCVLVQGEAGVGKTSLLQALRCETADSADWLWGACEPLLAPPPLAPLVDLLDQLPPTLAAAITRGGQSAAVMAGMLQRLKAGGRPVVLVIDDAQWADSATLDLLRYLGRRIENTAALLVLAWRQDSAADEALRSLLAALPAGALLRLTLAPLSPAAVQAWSERAGRDGDELYRVTQGNPFFVSQLLDSQAGQLPAAVRDAVLARALPLDGNTREVLDLVSVSPGELPLAVIEAVFEHAAMAVDACVDLGLLRLADGLVGFRHELARKSVESALSSRHAQALHAALFDALSLRGAAPARLVHHAEAGGIGAAVLRLAPLAAAEAAAGAASRQAAEMYALALRHATSLSPLERAALHVAHAQACVPANRLADAIASRKAALALHQAADEPLLQAIDHRHLARLAWMRSRAKDGLPHAEAAVALLQDMPGAARELALAQATVAEQHLLDDTPDATLHWAHQALPTFEALQDPEGLAMVLTMIAGCTLRLRDSDTAWSQLQHSLDLARQHHLQDLALQTWLAQATMGLVHHRHEDVRRALDEGLAYCEANDIDFYAARLRIRGAYGWMNVGEFERSRQWLHSLLSGPPLLALENEQAHHTLALLQLRQGEAQVQGYWREMIEGTRQLSVDPWYAPLALVRVEAAWWLGDLPAARALAQSALPEAHRRGEPWRLGHLLAWAQRLGLDASGDAGVPEPIALELRGQVHAAAHAWQRMGCGYEQLLLCVCAQAADAELLRRGLAQAQAMGCAPAAALARRRLRALGDTATAPAGAPQPRRARRADPLGLTPRERRVLELLHEGLTNRQIAQRLVRSERTVEKHVAALLDKLGVATRAEAAARLTP